MKSIVAGVVVIAILVVAVFAIRKSNNQNNSPQPQINFIHDGNVIKDNPGLKLGVWYLSYEEPSAPALSVELKFAGQDTDLRPGMRVHLEGMNSNNVVEVSKIQILNAYKSNLIWLDSPKPGDTVTSPITLHGYARGNWYFEASFPVKVLDANGTILGQTPAKAQGDWMTTDYVEFMASVSYTKTSTATGTLVLEKDNPSGLPQNADELRLPIIFGTEGRAVKLYYYNPDKDKDSKGNIICSSQGLVAVDRQIPITNTPIQDTIKLLIAGGLTQSEKNLGITTEFPLPGLELKGANLVEHTLTLEFVDPQNKTVGGSCRVSVLWAQIQATAKQFPGITTVNFKPAELFQP